MVSYHPWVDGENPQTRLEVRVVARLADGCELSMLALIDTGAEVALVRRGLIPDRYFRRSDKPMNFVTANRTILEGGKVEVGCTLCLEGKNVELGAKESVLRHTVFL